MTGTEDRLDALEAHQIQADVISKLSIENRITTLEQQQKHANELLEQLRVGQEAMSNQLTKYHGFLGGIMLSITCIWAVFTVAKDWIGANWFGK